MSQNYTRRSLSSYRVSKSDRDRDRDIMDTDSSRYYDGKHRNYHHWSDTRSGSVKHSRNRSLSEERRRYNDRSRKDSYYSRDYDDYSSRYRDRDNDRNKSYDRDRDTYDRDRYRHHSSNRDNDYYKNDRYDDYSSRYRDRDNKRNRYMHRIDEYEPSRDERKRDKRYDSHYDKTPTPFDDMKKDDYIIKDPLLHSPQLPTTDLHVRDNYEPSESSNIENKNNDNTSTNYKDYTTALLAGTSIKTGMYMWPNQKKLLKKSPIDTLKPSTSTDTPSTMAIDNKLPVSDPRIKAVAIGKKVVSLFDCVKLPMSHRAVTTLESPIVDFHVNGNEICDMVYNHEFIVSPLEKLNRILHQKIPSVKSVKWIPGCNTLLIMGLPRHLTSHEALNLLVEVYNKYVTFDGYNIIYDDDWLTDDENRSHNFSNVYVRKKVCKKSLLLCGIAEFHLLFGDESRAKNSLDSHYHQSTWRSTVASIDSTTIKIPEAPNAMALVVFYNEAKAKDFWITINNTSVHVHSCLLQCLPDPTGLRIYAEALASSFNPDLIKNKSNKFQLHIRNIKKEDDRYRVKKEPNEPNIDKSTIKYASSVYCWKPDENDANNNYSDCIKIEAEYNTNSNDITSKPSNTTFIPIACTINDDFIRNLKDMGFKIDTNSDSTTIISINDNIMQRHCIHNRVFQTPDGKGILSLFIKFNNSIIPLIQNQTVITFTNPI